MVAALLRPKPKLSLILSVAMLAVSLIGCGLAPAPTAHPSSPTPVSATAGSTANPDARLAVTRASDKHLWLMGEDGAWLRRLTDLPGAEFSPTWSPNGTRIAFRYWPDLDGSGYGGTDVYVVNVDGSGLMNLTNSSGDSSYLSPAWSPDGNKIIFSTDRSPGATPQVGSGTFKQKQIYIINPDGSGLVNLTDDASVEDGFAAWTPDGQIAYLEMVNPDSPPQPELWVMNADGSGKRRLAADVAFVAWRP